VFREIVLAIVRKCCADFGPTLVAEIDRVGRFVRSRTDYDATAPLVQGVDPLFLYPPPPGLTGSIA
jgi:hypothetical protein